MQRKSVCCVVRYILQAIDPISVERSLKFVEQEIVLGAPADDGDFLRLARFLKTSVGGSIVPTFWRKDHFETGDVEQKSFSREEEKSFFVEVQKEREFLVVGPANSLLLLSLFFLAKALKQMTFVDRINLQKSHVLQSFA